MCNMTIHTNMNNLIAVTNRSLSDRPFLEQIKRVCALHPKAVILREKDLPEEEYLLLADQVLAICKEYAVTCVLHSFVSAARTLHAPYIHLPLPLLREFSGAADPDCAASQDTTCNRHTLSDFTKIGTSVHSVEEAVEAQKLGASYLTAGHIYATDCKKGLPPRGVTFLEDVCRSVSIPVYAIGGIHLMADPQAADNSALLCPRLPEVMTHGAAGACVMSDMMRI